MVSSDRKGRIGTSDMDTDKVRMDIFKSETWEKGVRKLAKGLNYVWKEFNLVKPGGKEFQTISRRVSRHGRKNELKNEIQK